MVMGNIPKIVDATHCPNGHALDADHWCNICKGYTAGYQLPGYLS